VKWLSTYPGDLQVRLLYARSLLAEDDQLLKQQARQILEEICLYDPEFVEAQKYLAKAQREYNLETAETTQNCVLALGGAALRLAHGPNQQPDWAIQLRSQRLLERKKGQSAGSLEQARLLSAGSGC
jgi:hypothetical protein